jgi:hypothetical protein
VKKKHIVYLLSALFGLFIILGVYIFTKDKYPLLYVHHYKQPHLEKSYDVVVVGGEPEGVAAAVAAARSGSKTLLIEHRNGLGGVMTYGALNFLDLSNDKDGRPANQGIFEEWHKLVGNQTGFDIKDAKLAFLKLVQDEDNLTLALDTDVTGVVKNQSTNLVTGIKIKDYKGKPHTINAKRFIDSTQDGDFAFQAGAPSFEGGADIGLADRKMAATLMIHLENVDWDTLKKDAHTGVHGGATSFSNVIWGFGGLFHEYKPHFENTRLRGLNIVKQKDGTVYINALQIFGVDGLSDVSKKNAIQTGKKETGYIVKYLRKNFPGFEKAKIVDFPSELYVRETRHILAEYQLSMADVWENKDQWDSIGFGAYPVDVQATSPNDSGYVLSGPVQYAIPFRSLVPLKVNGLLVASKASGYSSLAAGSARVLPTGMTVGQAAGVAASLSIKENESFRDMTKDASIIKTLRSDLKKQGALLYHFNLDYPYKGEWFDPAINELINYGLVVAGYKNELPVSKELSEPSFANLLSNGVQRAAPDHVNTDAIGKMRSLLSKQKVTVTRDKAAEMICAMYEKSVKGDAAWKWLNQKGILDETIKEKLPSNKRLVGSEGYYLAYLYIKDISK